MALYHKYRPQQFSEVVGQEHVVTTITNQITHDKVAHAYLFSGPRGVGKTTMARLLAKAVNGKKKKGSPFEPDPTDPAVIEISESRAIDVIEIDAASHTGVDNVRENIIENAQFKPTSLQYKVFIIDEVHMLSTSAFNALLKTLEEPPEHVLFILATTELHKLPETIISRCQRFTFKKIPYETLEKQILLIAKEEKIKVDQDVVARIIQKSDGCVRDAISLLDQLFATGEKKITADVASLVLPSSNVHDTLSFLTHLIDRQAQKALGILGHLSDNGVSIPQFSIDLLSLERHLLIMCTSGTNTVPGADYSKEALNTLADLTTKITASEIVALTDMTLHRHQQIPTAPIEELPLEILVAEWCSENSKIKTTKQQNKDKQSKKQTKQSEQSEETVVEAREIVEESKKEQVHAHPVIEKVKELVSHKPFTTVQDVEKKWPKVLETVEESYPSMSFILKMANLVDVQGHDIKITLPYSFHKDKLESTQTQKALRPLLKEVFGVAVQIQARVEADTPTQPATDSEELHELAAAFGGEVVQ